MFRFCNIHGGGEAVGGVLVDEEKEVDEVDELVDEEKEVDMVDEEKEVDKVDELVDEEMTKGAIHHDKPAALGGGSPGQHGWFLQNKPALIDEGDRAREDADDYNDDHDHNDDHEDHDHDEDHEDHEDTQFAH